MRFKLINQGGETTFAVVFESGDEVVAGLREFAQKHNLSAAQFTAIGAFSEVELAYFDWEKKEYERRSFEEQLEVLSLLGDVSLEEARPAIHAHIVLGRRDFSVVGGHFMRGVVRPTLEVILTEAPRHLRRTHDARSGLSLINPDA